MGVFENTTELFSPSLFSPRLSSAGLKSITSTKLDQSPFKLKL